GPDVSDRTGDCRMGRLQKAAELFLLPQQPLDTSPQCDIAPADSVEEGGALRLRSPLHRAGKDFALVHGRTPRARTPSVPYSQCGNPGVRLQRNPKELDGSSSTVPRVTRPGWRGGARIGRKTTCNKRYERRRPRRRLPPPLSGPRSSATGPAGQPAGRRRPV